MAQTNVNTVRHVRVRACMRGVGTNDFVNEP